MRWAKFDFWAGLILILLLQGCASPSQKFIDTAAELGFDSQLVNGLDYPLRIFANQQARHGEAISELHVYLDGDGTPWTRQGIAEDPTPRNPLILQLMAADPAPSLLLGRPCYYSGELLRSCNNALWTAERYSAGVVLNMQAALEKWLAVKPADKLVLIGFSGGGTLAALLAERVAKVSTLVTIAANLDHDAWSDYHANPRLQGSLNPQISRHIPERVRQIHLAGEDDENVPSKIIAAFSASQKNSLYISMPGFEHHCCWLEIWPSFLKSYF